jgi:hypothetical protein
MGYRYIEIGIIILLIWIIIRLTLPFEQKYDYQLRELAKDPLFRTTLGLILIYASQYSVPVASLLFLVVFFLIADVHMVSTIKL